MCALALGALALGASASVTAAAPGLAWSVPSQLGRPVDNAISCPSTDECVAVDDAGNASYSSDASGAGTWGTFASRRIDSESLLSISCPTTTFCVAGDDDGSVVAGDPQGGGWNSPLDIDHSEAIWGVSCTSDTLCVAVDDDGNVLVSSNADGASPVWTVDDAQAPHFALPWTTPGTY